MASRPAAIPAKHLFNGYKGYVRQQPIRCMATEISLPNSTLSQTYADAHLTSTPTEPILEDKVSIPPPAPSRPRHHPFRSQQNPFLTTTQCTLYNFPSFEPTSLTTYPGTHLLVPLRKDILHRAVIYEGDATRSGTANTKYRTEVHGSNRKIRPQKGTGSARLGDKKSPMLRGGGVAFGPKPRDFSTELPAKIYDLAWRTALSYRYKMGELLVLRNTAELIGIPATDRARYVRELLRHNHLGHPDGRTLFVTQRERPNLVHALAEDKNGREARAVDVEDVDVKDLLEMGRVVVEKKALDEMFAKHERDLDPGLRLATWARGRQAESGSAMQEAAAR